jgi:hypothetical protein
MTARQDLPGVVGEQGLRAHQPLLSLSTLVAPRDYIELNGERHEMIPLAEFSAIRRQKVVNIWQEVIALLGKVNDPDEDLSVEDEERIEEGYSRLLYAAFPTVPRSMMDALPWPNKETLIDRFFQATTERTSRPVEEPTTIQVGPSTGATSSPGSSVSTARRTRKSG